MYIVCQGIFSNSRYILVFIYLYSRCLRKTYAIHFHTLKSTKDLERYSRVYIYINCSGMGGVQKSSNFCSTDGNGWFLSGQVSKLTIRSLSTCRSRVVCYGYWFVVHDFIKETPIIHLFCCYIYQVC